MSLNVDEMKTITVLNTGAVRGFLTTSGSSAGDGDRGLIRRSSHVLATNRACQAEQRPPLLEGQSFGALAQMMKAALSDRRIPFDPCQDVPLPAERHSEQSLTAGQVDLIANEIDPRFRALVFLAAYGGLRFGELAGLRRRRVDLLRGRVVVIETLVEANGRFIFGEPKTKRSRRTVPLPRRVVVELDNHLQSYVKTTPDALVFTGQKGAPLRRAGFRRSYWQPATRKAELEGLKVHELRHTFVALWVAAGVNPKEVSVRAGHLSVDP